MKVKTYRGSEMGHVMSQIRDELGDEAIIIAMRESGNVIEVEVGLENPQPVPMRKGLVDLREVEEPVENLEPKANLKSSIFPAEAKKTERLLKEILVRQGIDQRFAQEIVRGAEVDGRNALSADRYIANGLSKVMGFTSLLPENSRVVAMVGATGVGKTTTIAKLAARIRETFDLKIALISADSYRVGAGYHLQTYASLMNLPFRMVDGASATSVATQLRRAVDSFRDYDLVLIDTAGCGPREKGRIEDLASDLSLIPESEKILVLPAPGNEMDLHAAATSFGEVGCNRIVLSKLDESGFLGPVMNTVLRLDLPVAFATTGQRVPEDIEPASARRLAWMLTRIMH